MVSVKLKDNQVMQCYVSKPERQSAPAIVIVQEIFGITDWLKSFADGLAAKGYVAIVPDLFCRLEPNLKLDDNNEKELQKAFKLYGQFDQNQGVDDLKEVVEWARKADGTSGKVGITGFCLGGLMTYFMACRSSVDCAVAYYGGGIDQHLDESVSIKKPFVLHLAENDQYINKAAQEKIIAALDDDEKLNVHIYPGVDHAFCRVGGHAYFEPAAKLANESTDEFFASNL
ncbi:MAG: dienelactone hydrolase family protein [Candidatus Obscuribacterales bacterium]|nr:dienelactone hydrolase family protein [Candidatus Obscuribacterales bacterium]